MTRYEQSKEIVDNPDKYHSLDVKEARSYVKGFEDGLESQQQAKEEGEDVKCCSCDAPFVRNDGNIDYCGNCGDDLE
jgi:hypothetical protein